MRVEVPAAFGDALLLVSRAWFVASGFAVFVLVFVAFHRTLDRLILPPIMSLLHAAQSLEDGKPDARFSCGSGDEFETLAETLNRIVERSERAREDLRTMNEALDLRVDELRDLNAGLDEANRLKSEFLANVSHELRTPLGIIIGHADAMQSAFATQPPSEPAERSLKHIIESGHDLRQLIEELLALAKVEAGRIELHPVPLQLADLATGLQRVLHVTGLERVGPANRCCSVSHRGVRPREGQAGAVQLFGQRHQVRPGKWDLALASPSGRQQFGGNQCDRSRSGRP